MAIISVPERGQPLDVNYLYELAQAINNLSAQVSPSNYKYVSVDTPSSGTQNVKASEARIIGGFAPVFQNTTAVLAGDVKDFTYTFPADFRYAPVVTATPVNIGEATTAGKNVSVIIRAVSPGKVEGTVRFNEGGNLSIGVNLIAVGIPY